MKKKSDLRPMDAVLLLADCLTIFLLLVGSLLTYLSAYGVGTGAVTGPLLAGCALFAILSAALWSFRRGRWAALGLVGLWGILLWGLWDWLEPALFSLGETVAMRQELPESLLPVLLFLTAGLALLLGWLAVRARCWYLSAALALLPALPAMLAGTLPDLRAMLAGTVGWGCLLLTAFFAPRDRGSLGLAMLLSQGSLAALLVALFFALPMEGYRRPQWATDARQEIVQAVQAGVRDLTGGEAEWSGRLPQWIEKLGRRWPGGGSGGWGGFGLSESGDLNLRTVGPRWYTGRTVLTVSTDQEDPAGRVYLRGTAAGVYTGHSWEEVDEAADPDAWGWETVALNPSAGLPKDRYTMTIRHADASGTAAYYPYCLWQFVDEGVALNGHGGTEKPKGLREYRVVYVSGGPEEWVLLTLFSGIDPEHAYREFAYAHYTDVPPATRGVLEPLLDGLRGQEVPWTEGTSAGHLEAVDAARRTAALLSGLAVYDLDVPAMAEGKDFVERFLAEGRGYCVHFATLGTLLLRMQGIPARFVSGYVADLDDSGRAAVRDSDAHAWVEIYLDGYGWYPVEMTPGYREAAAPGGAVEAGTLPESGGEPEDSVPDDPLSGAEDLPIRPHRTQEDVETDLMAPENPGPGEPQGPEVGELGGDMSRELVNLTWLARAGSVLLILAAPAAVYRGAQALRRRRRDQPDTNCSTIAAYRRCRRLLAWGQETDEALEALARKAKFSQHILTPEERTAAWECLDQLVRRTERTLPRWKRWCFVPLKPLY